MSCVKNGKRMGTRALRKVFQFPKKISRRKAGEIAESQLAFLMNLPTVIVLAIFIAYPLFYALFLSFHNVKIINLRRGGAPFTGIDNYVYLFTDPIFLATLKNSFIFLIMSVSGQLMLGFIIALAMYQEGIRLSHVTRVLLLVPWAVPPMVNGLLWRFIYHSDYGYLNGVLIQLGFIDKGLLWLGDDKLVLPSIAFAYVWRTTPFAALLYHTALQQIPEELMEAADVDGAGGWYKLTRIIIPLLMPVTVILLILRTTFTFETFDEVYSMTKGGPGSSSWIAAWYTYSVTFKNYLFGLGAASSYVFGLIVGILAIIYVMFLYRRYTY